MSKITATCTDATRRLDTQWAKDKLLADSLLRFWQRSVLESLPDIVQFALGRTRTAGPEKTRLALEVVGALADAARLPLPPALAAARAVCPLYDDDDEDESTVSARLARATAAAGETPSMGVLVAAAFGGRCPLTERHAAEVHAALQRGDDIAAAKLHGMYSARDGGVCTSGVVLPPGLRVDGVAAALGQVFQGQPPTTLYRACMAVGLLGAGPPTEAVARLKAASTRSSLLIAYAKHVDAAQESTIVLQGHDVGSGRAAK